MSMFQRGSKERILLCEAKQGIAGAKRRLAKQTENQILIAGRICGPHVYFQGLNQGQWEYHRLCVTSATDRQRSPLRRSISHPCAHRRYLGWMELSTICHKVLSLLTWAFLPFFGRIRSTSAVLALKKLLYVHFINSFILPTRPPAPQVLAGASLQEPRGSGSQTHAQPTSSHRWRYNGD